MVISSLLLFFVRGPTWGIDFTGGTEIQFQFSEETSISELREAIRDQGLSDDSVQQVGEVSENTFVVRIQDPNFGTEDIQQSVKRLWKALLEQIGLQKNFLMLRLVRV